MKLTQTLATVTEYAPLNQATAHRRLFLAENKVFAELFLLKDTLTLCQNSWHSLVPVTVYKDG